MTTALARGEPLSASDRTQIQVPRKLAESARIVAALTGKSIASLIAEIAGPELARREKELLDARRTEVEDASPVEPPKRGRPKKGGGG